MYEVLEQLVYNLFSKKVLVELFREWNAEK